MMFLSNGKNEETNIILSIAKSVEKSRGM